MASPLLVFDLDGTLVDTAADLIGTLNKVLVAEGLRTVRIDDAGALIGAGARAMVERGLHLNGVTRSAAEMNRLYATFLDLYAADIAEASRPFPGLLDALDRFAAAGWMFAVCTNKPEALSLKLLGALGLTERFRAICGGDTFAVRKPAAGHLVGTIERAGGSRDRTVMVGDSLTDVAAARNARVPVVAVTFGYTDEPVASYDPDVVIDRYDQLWDAVVAIEAARAA